MRKNLNLVYKLSLRFLCFLLGAYIHSRIVKLRNRNNPAKRNPSNIKINGSTQGAFAVTTCATALLNKILFHCYLNKTALIDYRSRW